MLSMDNMKKRTTNRWTPEEHARLEELVLEFGTEQWTEIAARMPGRTNKQVRQHWVNFSRPETKQANWSAEEEETIAQMHATYGPSWSVIARCLGNRTENNVKNHWHATFRSKAHTARPDSILCVYITLLNQGNKPNLDTYQQAKAQVAAYVAMSAAIASANVQQGTGQDLQGLSAAGVSAAVQQQFQEQVLPYAGGNCTSLCVTNTQLGSEQPTCSMDSSQLNNGHVNILPGRQQLMYYQPTSPDSPDCNALTAMNPKPSSSPSHLYCPHPSPETALCSPPISSTSQQYNNNPFSSGNLSTSSFQSLSHSTSHASLASLSQRRSGSSTSETWTPAVSYRSGGICPSTAGPATTPQGNNPSYSLAGSPADVREKDTLSFDPDVPMGWDVSIVKPATSSSASIQHGQHTSEFEVPMYEAVLSNRLATGRNKRPLEELLCNASNIDMTPGRFSLKRSHTCHTGMSDGLSGSEATLQLRRANTTYEPTAMYNTPAAPRPLAGSFTCPSSGQLPPTEIHPSLRDLRPVAEVDMDRSGMITPLPAVGSLDLAAWLDSELMEGCNHAHASNNTAMNTSLFQTHPTPCTPPGPYHTPPRVSLDAPHVVPGSSTHHSPAASLLRHSSDNMVNVAVGTTGGQNSGYVQTPPGSLDLVSLLDSLGADYSI